MPDDSKENIERILNQINALMLASDTDDALFLSNEFAEKLKEMGGLLEKSDKDALRTLSKDITAVVKQVEQSNPPDTIPEDFVKKTKAKISEIESIIQEKALQEDNSKSTNGESISISEEDLELFDDFLTESREHLQKIEEVIIELENNTDDKELINGVFRAFHTIKGNSAFLDLKSINVLSHRSENLLDALRNDKIQFTPELTDIILESVDLLKKMLISLEECIGQKNTYKNEEDISSILEKIEKAISPSPAEKIAEVKSSESIKGEKTADKKEEISSDKPFILFSEDTDKSFLPDFVTECREYLENAESALLELESDPKNSDAVNTVFRAFHTIKGTSSFLGIIPVSELCHKVESLLIPIRDGLISFTEGYADLSLRGIDLLKELIALVENPEPEIAEPDDFGQYLKDLDNLDNVLSKNDDDDAHIPKIGEILLGEGKVSKDDIEKASSSPSNEPIGVKLIKNGLASTQDVAKALRKQRKIANNNHHESSVRVRTDRLDKLIDMVGELVISHSMIAQDSFSVDSGDNGFQKKVSHSGKIVRELQDLSLAIRMVPMKPTFQKMVRLVRDLSRKSDKTINFITNGEETEIDRHMVDVINDPLVHLLRNSVDHGVENSEVRAQWGKKAEGTISLSAYHSGGNVVIEIHDDGKGLDRDKILEKAISKGFVKPGMNLTDQEIFDFIFMPGFSTAEKVTEISGRGVGLDVVKKNIESLKGKIHLLSEKGKGSTFVIYLPLTMAITDGMLVKVGNQRFIIPTINISMSYRPEKNAISTIAGKGEIVKFKDKILPLFRLSTIFGISNGTENASENIFVIINDNQNSYVLAVDELLGQQQVVAKSLECGLVKIPVVSGGAILSDGKVGIILDPTGIYKMATNYKAKEIA